MRCNLLGVEKMSNTFSHPKGGNNTITASAFTHDVAYYGEGQQNYLTAELWDGIRLELVDAAFSSMSDQDFDLT